MKELKEGFPPGVDYRIAYDTSLYVRDSVNDVIWTLVSSIVIVAIVVMVFLQSWRAAIIPLIAIPVSVLGTFAAMIALGFSLNNISLFGLVLAIGIVVDDAIVVVENVERWLERGLAPKEATYKAMSEVTGPIIAVALVLCAVFVPCAFIRGITGQFFRQFAITIAVSTVISTINSLTFSPAMAAILLKPKGTRRDVLSWVIFILFGWFFWLFNKTFGAITSGYSWSVGKAMKLRILVLAAYAGMLLLTVVSKEDLPDWLRNDRGNPPNLLGRIFLKAVKSVDSGFEYESQYESYPFVMPFPITTFRDAPKGFIPAQDQGRCIVNVQLPDASSLDRTYDTVLQVERVALDTPGVGHTITNAGMSFLLQANSPNFAALFIVLKPFEVRQKGWYKFSDKEFEAMRNDGMPENLVAKLDPATMSRDELIAALAAPVRVPRQWDLLSDSQLRRRLKNKEYDWDEFEKVMEALLDAGGAQRVPARHRNAYPADAHEVRQPAFRCDRHGEAADALGQGEGPDDGRARRCPSHRLPHLAHTRASVRPAASSSSSRTAAASASRTSSSTWTTWSTSSASSPTSPTPRPSSARRSRNSMWTSIASRRWRSASPSTT